MKSPPCLFFVLNLLCFGTLAADLKWDRLPDLPPGSDQEKQIGVAGAFTGVHNEVLIVAGERTFLRDFLGNKLNWDCSSQDLP